MKPEELRIGNLVLLRNTSIGGHIEIESINKFGIELYFTDLDGIEPTWEFDQIKGIPLTEEWLERFGFEENVHFFNTSSYYLRKSDSGGFELWVDFYQPKERMICKIHHVHQLQNLYYALTGNELTIK